MASPSAGPIAIADAWKRARSGDLKSTVEAVRRRLGDVDARDDPATLVELYLVCAACAIRQGDPVRAMHDLDAATGAAPRPGGDGKPSSRILAWRAELAYFQGRYSEANELVSRLDFERDGDLTYAAFVLRIRIAILLARGDYDGIASLADRAVALAQASGDAYVLVQILNVLGAAHFDRATSKLREPHARAHLSALDPADTAPMEEDARTALTLFEQARAAAEDAGYEYAAWYVAGNIERLEILLGRAKRAVGMIRRRLEALQARGARYDEIVTRSNLAWGLRLLGQHREALHEIDVALGLARDTGTSNVMLEYLEYDRSIVLDALGDAAAARASYRRYLQLVGAYNRGALTPSTDVRPSAPRRPLEPFFLKRADRFVRERLGERFTIDDLARHCGVALRTLEKAFADYRGVTPVAHAKNARLDRARLALDRGEANIADIAHRCGFRSATTFTLEYRKRFGVPPSRTKRLAR